MKRSAILGIDLVRFMAATSVILWHFAGKPFLAPAGATLTPLMPPLMPPLGRVVPPGVAFSWYGWVGVEIFFVISGVVIAFSAERAAGPTGARGFFVGRVARLWPAMLVSASLCSILSVLVWHTPVLRQLRRYAGSLVFAPVGPWFSGQVWTLPVEIMFYGVVWMLVATHRVRWLERVGWTLASASLLYWIGVLAGALPAPNGYVALTLLPHGCYFATGILLARIAAAGLTRARGAALMLCGAAAMIEISRRAAEEMAGAPYAYDPVVPCLVWIGGVAAIWASLHWRDAIATRLAGRHRVFTMMGALTYPLYLVHYQTGGPVFAALYARGVPLWLAIIPAYLVALGCAYLIAHVAEPPLSGWIKRRLPVLLDRVAALRQRAAPTEPGYL